MRRDIAQRFGGENLNAELAVRSLLAGAPQAIPVGAAAGTEVWAALAEKRMPKKVEGRGVGGASPLGAWTCGRGSGSFGRP